MRQGAASIKERDAVMRIFKSVFNSAYQTIDHYPFSTAFLIIAAICVFAAVRVAMG